MPARCKERELILASGDVDVPALPLGAVRGYLCCRCFEHSDKILKCGACKRVGYCSKKCQKLDWVALHMGQCKLLRQINELELQDYQNSRTWVEYTQHLHRYIRIVRAASPLSDTNFIIQAQPHCSGCHRSANQLTNRKVNLTPCARCHLVHFCSDCPDTHSTAVCIAYQVHAHIEQFRIDLFEDTGQASVTTCTDTPRTKHRPLKDSAGWYDYYVDISDKAMIKNKINSDFSKISDTIPPAQREFEERRRLFLLLGTDTLTMPLTIVSALEDLSWPTKDVFTIHLLGATGREFLAMSSFEEILHLLPALKAVHITAIGPSSWQDDTASQNYVPSRESSCCPKCQSLGRKRSLASYKGLYHTFAQASFYERPDLIVAFNSGCADGDDAETHWDQTIRLIVDGDIPALFTTYNAEEAQHERAKMKSLKAKFVVEPGENKWKGLVPKPEFLDREFEMWYQNCWRYIIQGKM